MWAVEWLIIGGLKTLLNNTYLKLYTLHEDIIYGLRTYE